MPDLATPTGRPTRASQLTATLRAQILCAAMEPGARINLDQLRDIHRVSLSPLREAISRLVSDGLIIAEDQRGYRVAPMSRENLAEIQRLRVEIEPMALSFAIAHAGIGWEADILAALHRLDRAQRQDQNDWPRAHSAFHAALVSGCAMPLLIEFCEKLAQQFSRYQCCLAPDAPSILVPDHAALAQIAVARDAAAAIALLKTHLAHDGTVLLHLYDKSPIPMKS